MDTRCRNNVRQVLSILSFLFLNLCTGLAVSKPEISSDLGKWREYPFPEEPEFWWGLNSSEYGWHVDKDGDQIIALERNQALFNKTIDQLVNWIDLDGDEVGFFFTEGEDQISINTGEQVYRVSAKNFTEFDNGFFLTRNKGEWGGSIWFFPKDLSPGYRVSNDQVQALYKLKGRLFGLEGLAHLSLDDGRVIELRRSKTGRWESHTVLKLPSAPEASLKLDDSSCLVVTNTAIVVFSASKHMEVLFKDLNFGGVYPRTVVRAQNGNVFVGMRHVVLKIVGIGNDSKPRLSVLVPYSGFIEERLVNAKAAAADRIYKESFSYKLSRLEMREILYPAAFIICLLIALIIGVIIIRRKVRYRRRQNR